LDNDLYGVLERIVVVTDVVIVRRSTYFYTKEFRVIACSEAYIMTGMESTIKGYRSSTFYGRIISEYSKGQETNMVWPT